MCGVREGLCEIILSSAWGGGTIVCLWRMKMREDSSQGRLLVRAWPWLDRGADDKIVADWETNRVSFRACACNPSETALE